MKKLKLLPALFLVTVSAINAHTGKQPNEAKTKAIVEQFFGYTSQKDFDKIPTLFTESIDWYIFESKYMPWTGHRTKSAQLPETIRTLESAFISGIGKLEVTSFIIKGNEAVVIGTASRTVKTTNKSFTTPFTMHFTLKDGLITKFLMYEETLVIEKAFIK